MLLTYMIFGMAMLIPALERINLTIVFYGVLSLTLVRMLPMAISLIGAKLRPMTVLFLGWSGPRSIASILYVLTVLETENSRQKNHLERSICDGVFECFCAWH